MFWIIVFFVVGWWTGRNWEMVKKFASDKLNSSKNIEGKATRMDQD